jgi:hypothetical protein
MSETCGLGVEAFIFQYVFLQRRRKPLEIRRFIPLFHNRYFKKERRKPLETRGFRPLFFNRYFSTGIFQRVQKIPSNKGLQTSILNMHI